MKEEKQPVAAELEETHRDEDLLEFCYVFLHDFHSLLHLGRGLPSLLAAPGEVANGARQVILPLRGSGVRVLWSEKKAEKKQKRRLNSVAGWCFKAKDYLVG